MAIQIYLSMNYYCWHYPWGKRLGGETLSPYLSLCSMDAICSENMLWVVLIMEDYMIVEYVGFAKSKLLHRPFLKKDELQLFDDWEHSLLVFKKVYDLYFNMWKLVTWSWEALWYELLLWHIMMLQKVIEIIIDQTCAPASIHTS